MKELKIDFDAYLTELEDSYKKGYTNGGQYAIKAMLEGEPYPKDVQEVIDSLKKQD